MAGMLPGVECARRRRFHQSGGLSDSAGARSRRPSFCLYTSSHEPHHISVSTLQRSLLNQTHQDEKLGGLAREAKERLDERLRTKRNSDSKRHNGKKALRLLTTEARSTVQLPGEMQLQIEVFGPKKRRFSWYKLSSKASEEEDCAVCLDRYKAGETLVHLPCAHRFHLKCLVPWLETNTHCPCCRMAIIIT